MASVAEVVSETPEPEIDWPTVRQQRRAARLEHGEVATVQFEGKFVGGGLPEAPTRAIPLDSYDLRFILVVSVTEIRNGELPEGWLSPLVFGVHSPSIFFRLQGVVLEREKHVPAGDFLFTLWRSPDGQYALEVEPLE